jgi:uncharacterized paraquat-inducible protein A
MSKVKQELVSKKPCLYCDNLFAQELEEAGYTVCPRCQQVVTQAVDKLLAQRIT